MPTRWSSRKLLTTGLLVLVATALVVSIVRVSGQNGTQIGSGTEALPNTTGSADESPNQEFRGFSSPPSDSSETQSDCVVVYLFHGVFRCPTCIAIEKNTKEVIASHFADELREGKVRITEVNVEEPSNWHFIDKYNLVAPTVVMVRMHKGKETRFANLMKVWQLIRNKADFTEFIVNNLRQMLGEGT
jgi:hypothetical protein